MLTQNQIFHISIVVFGCLLTGWLVKKILFPFLLKITKKTKWKSDDLVIESIGHWVIFWFFLGGCIYILPILVQAFSISDKLNTFFNNLFGSLFIFSISWVVARVVAGMIQIRSENDGSEIPSTSILGNIIKVIIYCLGFILILQTFNIAIAPLVTALGVGGLAVALALQPTLSNLFSGLQIIASGKINIGDFVQLENGKKGIVKDITWRNTIIETSQNNIVIVPNSKMADSIIENFYLINKEITFNIPVRVSYESDLEKVEKVSIEVVREVLNNFDGGIKEFNPFVHFYNFGEYTIELKIFLRVNEYADQFLITSEFIKALQKRYKIENIIIPFPVQTVLLGKAPE
jgi:small-conductance mechanosensitive channel